MSEQFCIHILISLLARGDILSIDCGRFNWRFSTGKRVPADLLKKYSAQFVKAIASRDPRPVFLFESFTTGQYTSHIKGGVTLQFTSLLDTVTYHSIFNAIVTRSRSSRHGEAGQRLPGKQFTVSQRHQFYKFWVSAGLKVPPRLSSFHDYMGNLKDIYFTASLTGSTRLKKDSIKPLSITHEDLLENFLLLTDKPRTSAIQMTDNCQTRRPYKESAKSQRSCRLETNSSTCAFIQESRKQGWTGTSTPINSIVDPKEQSTEEWLADYGPA